jgi:hypothetical protein
MKSAANPREYTRIKPMERSIRFTVSFLRTLLATLREIFDENAYHRFLLRTGSAASVQSYREFQRERESAMATKPRCC